jgi:hypothetical protein
MVGYLTTTNVEARIAERRYFDWSIYAGRVCALRR